MGSLPARAERSEAQSESPGSRLRRSGPRGSADSSAVTRTARPSPSHGRLPPPLGLRPGPGRRHASSGSGPTASESLPEHTPIHPTASAQGPKGARARPLGQAEGRRPSRSAASARPRRTLRLRWRRFRVSGAGRADNAGDWLPAARRRRAIARASSWFLHDDWSAVPGRAGPAGPDSHRPGRRDEGARLPWLGHFESPRDAPSHSESLRVTVETRTIPSDTPDLASPQGTVTGIARKRTGGVESARFARSRDAGGTEAALRRIVLARPPTSVPGRSESSSPHRHRLTAGRCYPHSQGLPA